MTWLLTIGSVVIIIIIIIYLHYNEERINREIQERDRLNRLYLSPRFHPTPEPGLELTNWYNEWIFEQPMYDYQKN